MDAQPQVDYGSEEPTLVTWTLNDAPNGATFAALGDETRLRLVALLCAGGVFSITHLTAGTDISRQAVTRHLQVLAAAGLVKDIKMGRERLWQFDPTQLDEARRTLDLIGQQWETALAALKAYAEGDES